MTASKDAGLKPVPFSKRPLDWLYVLFFLINIFFITPIVDGEQLTQPMPLTPDDARAILAGNPPAGFVYPAFPPKAFVDLNLWYGSTYDPLQLARPAWWKATIAWDVLFFWPFYMFATYAFIKGREWIRLPAIIYGCVISTIVTIILFDEWWGVTPALNIPFVTALNMPWLCLPASLVFRFATKPVWFSTAGSAKKTA